ncbi:Theileria-specific hypothetical protein, putative [Theileria annulata]|uniref:Uncharacterized protein n=1 Tax=Theileria annulata TaxID=5874 RepID=Q4UBA3_THEAN|nr:Theileria-specific hypothetical protein, putative [Theileria annulata]CAI75898.1 Theileria-specific hypothetical protein, putative [Theileria annulata]|eukprot:XP_955374.1 Theileria-specific hypothetical protein, putative [Theileria annulata]
MDSIRTKKSTKKAWIVGGILLLGLVIIALIVSLAISGVFDSDKDQKVAVPTITTVPDAFEFIEQVYKKNYPKVDDETTKDLKDLELIKKQIIARLDLKKEIEDEEKKMKESSGTDKETTAVPEKLEGDKLEESEGSEDKKHLKTRKSPIEAPSPVDVNEGELEAALGKDVSGEHKETVGGKAGETENKKTEIRNGFAFWRKGSERNGSQI